MPTLNTIPALAERTAQLFREHLNANYRRTDRMFAWLMPIQWLVGIAAALWISPRAWEGQFSHTHIHVWAALLLGGLITWVPVWLAVTHPGAASTRHAVAIGQVLMSGLLVHLSGGRIETHFHYFGSLAFIAFYRDWRVLLSATVVVAIDHCARGLLWPQSMFGILTSSSWRWLEHTGWVLFEDIFLLQAMRQNLRELFGLAERQAKLETLNETIEDKVGQRTAALKRAQDEAAQKEGQLRFIFEAVPFSVTWIYRHSDRIDRMMNKAFYRITGLSSEKIPDAADVRAVSHPDDLKRQDELRGRLDRGEIDQFGMEKRYLRPSGEIVWVFLTINVFRGPEGQILQEVSTLVDITERKQIEMAQAAWHQISEAAQSARDLPALFARVHEIVGGFMAARNFYVALHDKLTGDLSFPFFADESDSAPVPRPMGQGLTELVLRTGKPLLLSAAKIEAMNEQGTIQLVGTRPLDWLGVPLRSQDRTFGVLAVQTYAGTVRYSAKDLELLQFVAHELAAVLERKQAEAAQEDLHRQLLDTSRQAGMAEVATGVLHNVGNVLNSVNVSATLVADQVRRSKVPNLEKICAMLAQHANDLGTYLASDAKGKMIPAYLSTLAETLAVEHGVMLAELDNLHKNIGHIKDVVAMQQSYAKTSGVAETVSVADLVEDALRMNAGSLARHDVDIARDYGSRPVVTLEKHKVLQILVNLVRNAKHACDDSGRTDKLLTTRITADDRSVTITVGDNGVGIPPENLTRIFAHGFTTKKDGHGFGLHNGALAAKELGGSLTVQSDGPGRGATFTLKLPFKPSSPTS